MEIVPKASQTITIGPQNLNDEILKMKSLEEFIKLNPPVFRGGSDPSEADTWLYSIKTMFDRIGVSPEHRVGFAAFLFEGTAEKWWDQNWSGKKVVGIAWKGFVELLRSEFSCESPDWDTKTGFRDLVQTNTVAEYRTRFEVLSCCDPSMETNPASKRAKFRNGLKPVIRAHLRPYTISDFEELVAVALGVEADLNEDQFLGSDSGDFKTCECPAKQLNEMTVEQYCAEFAEEHRPSFDGEQKADRVLKCIRFRCGLNPDIKWALKRYPRLYDFDSLVEAAKSAEAAMAGDENLGREWRRKENKKLQKEQQEMQRVEKEERLLEKKRRQEEKHRQAWEMKQQRKEEKQRKHLEKMKQEQEAKKQRLADNAGPHRRNKKAKFV